MLQRAWRDAAASAQVLRLQCRVSLRRAWAGAPCAWGRGGPGALLHAAGLPCSLPLPQGAGGRPVLYQVVARHSYSAQGPEDLDLQPGNIVDVLCEGQWGAGAQGVSVSRYLMCPEES